MKMIHRVLFVSIALLLSFNAFAFSMERYVDGVHYKKLEGVAPQSQTVIEFFSFGCPHCNHLEPHVEEWLKTKPEGVMFNRVPAVWNKKFQVLAHLYYALEELGKLDDSVQKTFDYIHKQGKHIHSKKEAVVYLKTLGITEEAINKAWQSEAVSTKVRDAASQYSQHQVRGVPAVVVNGQYQTSVSMAGSEKELFHIIEFLLAK